MNENPKKRLGNFLLELSAIQQVLVQDCEYALKRAFSPVEPAPDGMEALPEPVVLERMVWWRVAIRTFLTWPEANTSFMRRTVRIEAEQGRARLSESLLQRLRRRGSLTDRVKEGFKAWSAAFDVGVSLDTGGQDWQAFRALADARHKATHPTKLEDLYPVSEMPKLIRVVAWYLIQEEALFRASAEKVGTEIPALTPPQLPDSDVEAQQLPALPYDQIAADALSSLRLHHRMMAQLFHEVGYLMGWLNNQNLRQVSAPATQFALRSVIRSLCSVTEGMGWSAHRFLTAAQQRRQISIPPDLQRRIDEETKPALDRVVASFEAHSLAFGNSHRIDHAGSSWRAFNEVWRVRDRLTHPGGVADLLLSRWHIGVLALALGWHIEEVGKVLELDVDKWADLASNPMSGGA